MMVINMSSVENFQIYDFENRFYISININEDFSNPDISGNLDTMSKVYFNDDRTDLKDDFYEYYTREYMVYRGESFPISEIPDRLTEYFV